MKTKEVKHIHKYFKAESITKRFGRPSDNPYFIILIICEGCGKSREIELNK